MLPIQTDAAPPPFPIGRLALLHRPIRLRVACAAPERSPGGPLCPLSAICPSPGTSSAVPADYCTSSPGVIVPPKRYRLYFCAIEKRRPESPVQRRGPA